MLTQGKHRSLWLSKENRPAYPTLSGDLTVDTAVIGAGITGLTAALLLKRAGKTVAVLERETVASGTSGNTTAHISSFIDSDYHTLERSFGAEGIRLIARSMQEAIDFIEQFAREYCIDCGFERVPGYYFAESEQDAEEVRKEYEAALTAGLPVELTPDIPLPYKVSQALIIQGQGRFHAVSYLDSLAQRIHGDGCQIFEHTYVLSVKDGEPVTLETERGTVRAKDVVMATHTPLGISLVHTAVAPYRSYALAARVNGPIPDGLFWDTGEPYNYLRKQSTPEGDVLIVGGKDHKTAHSHEPDHFDQLEKYTREHFDVREITNYWSSQYYEPADGIPFIGLSPQSSHTYIGTGYSGDGIPFGTLAGIVNADLILGHKSPYADLYRPLRLNFSGVRHFVSENIDVAKRFITDRLSAPNKEALLGLSTGEGTVIKMGRQSVAAYRDPYGNLHACSAVCTHMRCIVRWNAAEKTFDCPCHGARYSPEGVVLEGPTTKSLPPIEIKEEEIRAKTA